MKIDQNELYRIILEEYVKEEGIDEALSPEKTAELIAWIKGGPRPEWVTDDLGTSRRAQGVQAPGDASVDRAADTMPFEPSDIPSDDAPERDVSGFQDRAGPPLEDQLMDLIQGLPPEEVADLFQAVFEKIPGVELGEPEEEPPETLYSPGAEGRPQVGFKEELMEIIKEELREFMGRPRPRYGEGNLTIDDVKELLPQLSPGEQVDVWEKYKHLNNQDDLRRALRMNEEENNPWAICTASVGREDKEKYEKCVKGVKRQNRGNK